MRQAPVVDEAQKGPAYAIKVGKLTSQRPSGYTLEELEISAPSAAEVQTMLRDLWSQIEGGKDEAPSREIRGSTKDVEAIRAAMIAQGLNQAKLAHRAGIRSNHLSMILRNRAGLSPANRHKLFAVLGIDQGEGS